MSSAITSVERAPFFELAHQAPTRAMTRHGLFAVHPTITMLRDEPGERAGTALKFAVWRITNKTLPICPHFVFAYYASPATRLR